MPANLIDALGWIGGGLLVVAYALVSLKKREPTSAIYRWLNIVGSALLIVNIVWIVIALLAFQGLGKRITLRR